MPEPIHHTLVHYTDEAQRDLFGDLLENFTAQKRLANWNQRGMQ